jgi:phosphatidate cytidylyltransferase
LTAPEAAPSDRRVSDLGRRVLTALVALPLLLAALLLGPPLLAGVLAALALLIALFEYFHLIEARGLKPFRLEGLALTVLLAIEPCRPGWAGPPLWPFAVLLLLGSLLLRRGELGAAVDSAAATLLGAIYLGVLGGCLAGLRLVDPSAGPWRLLLLLAIVMAADTAAYFVGRAFGNRPLAPRLSPKKTVEGALGGILGGVVGAVVVAAWRLESLPLLHAAALGAVVALFALLGDLFESLLKRWAGVKDSGTLFPGHGGMLDRLDSLLFGAPLLYYYFCWIR